jgi:galactose mutarotase-like enzyme
MVEPFQTLSSGRLEAAVSPLGAELRSLRVDGREVIWRADPAWWGSSAPILFPIVGGLNGDAYRVGGQSFNLPRHGFARRRRFELVEAAGDRAVFRLEADAQTRAVYPFDFRLDIVFQIAEALSVCAIVENRGSGPMPASFGFHPAFNWPLDPAGDRAAYRLVFDEDEPAPMRRLTGGGLVEPDPIPSPILGRDLPLTDALFADDALIFDQPRSRGLLYGAPGGLNLRIDYPDMPYLGVWTKPGAPFVCIEPWQGLADPEGYAGDLADKPGMVTLAPGAQRRFEMRVGVAP